MIVVDDGSKDATADIVASVRDDRIKFVRQENSGLTRSLNRAIALARGNWVARHDADDFSIFNRFETQLRYLNQHPEVGILGSSCFIQPERFGVVNEIYDYPQAHEEILAAFATYNPIVHGSTMIARTLLLANGGYNEKYRYVQDYELWSRLLMQTRAANLQTPLYVRSIHQETSQHKVNKEPIFNEIRDNFIARYGTAGDSSWFRKIESISLYPAITLRGSWNRSLRTSLRKISQERRRHGMSWLGARLLSLLYYPWGLS
jgi:glycosyltransferase involved in cell wall biosynthesis